MKTRAAARAAVAEGAVFEGNESTVQSDAANRDNVYGSTTPYNKRPITPEFIESESPSTVHYFRSERHRFRPTTHQQVQHLLTPPGDITLDTVRYSPPNIAPGGAKSIQLENHHALTVNGTNQATPQIKNKNRKINKEPVYGGWNVLPHNLGQLWEPLTNQPATVSVKEGAQVGASDSYQSTNAKIHSTSRAENNTTAQVGDAKYGIDLKTEHSLQAKKAATIPIPAEAHPSPPEYRPEVAVEATYHEIYGDLQLRKPHFRSQNSVTEDESKKSNEDPNGKEEQKKSRKKARKTKDNPYGLTPGETPYPDWTAPTMEQCQEIYDILAKLHDNVKPLPPDKIPAPSLDVAGCGEVPSVLDGLIRTVLSGSTTFDSADKMLQALVERFGVLEEGIGKGSVNWNNVRLAEYDEVYTQLKSGGLGKLKAKNIQAILGMVYDENMERRAAYLEEEETGNQARIPNVFGKTAGQKKLEILRADLEMLSLDHMHSMDTHEAMQHLVRYPGVGVKTAACVILFSLQRPCFAVDTHVFRLAKWLGWVPPKTNEDDTFRHLEVRCPDRLKYGLHQLFIRHGKTCYRCNDKTFSGTEAWSESNCPLEHLLNRHTKRAAKPKEINVTEKTNHKSKGKRKRDLDDDGKAEQDSVETESLDFEDQRQP